jgi:phosphatidylinositol alpha-mannosyltransferase
MKIGLVCPYNLYKGGGVQDSVLLLQKELSVRGHTVLILTPQAKTASGILPSFVRVLGTATDMKTPLHTTAQVSVSLDTRQLEALMEEEQFDLVHFHEPWVPFLARQILSRSEAKNVATFHAKLPDTTVSKALKNVITPYTRSVLKHLDSLTAVSTAASSYIGELTDRDIEIIPNSTDVNNFQHLKRRPTNSILYIGRLEKRKGVNYLITAFSELQKTDSKVKLIIAGDGPDKKKLKDLAKTLGINNIEFLGYISEEKKLELLSEAGVFCSPALYGESFGIVLIEAMAAGVPIVAGDNPGYATVMTGRGALSLVKPKDSINFAMRLDLMLTDEAIRTAMLEWGSEHVKQFDHKKIVDKYEKLYKSLVK